jgi:hypothetical protein
MKLLPWNNPLVVTSFMLRARKGGFFTGTTIYLGIVAMAYIGWHYAHANLDLGPRLKAQNPHKVFFLFLFAAQCIFSGIVVLVQAGAAIKNEVTNKTLDFQRIATVSSWDILIGKLLGNSTAAYLLAIAALPVGLFCVLSGVPGVGVGELLLMWQQMLTFLVLLGACAIQNTLQITTAKGTGSSPGFGIAIGIIAMVIFQAYAGSSPRSFIADPRQVSLAALFTPIMAFSGAQLEAPWAPSFHWFSLRIPCLIFSPVAHIVLAWLALTIMVRRLRRPDVTPLGKPLGYLFLGLADLLIVGVIASTSTSSLVLGKAGLSADQQILVFLFLHLIVTVLFLIAITPKQELIWSWIWRYRGRRPPPADAVLEDRSPNTAPLLISLVFGLICIAGLILAEGGAVTTDILFELGITVVSSVLLWGILYQAFHVIMAKYGGSLFLLTAFLFINIPIMVGAILASPGLPEYRALGNVILHLTPLSIFIKWMQGAAATTNNVAFNVSPYPVAIAYLLLAGVVYLFMRRRLQAMFAKVDRTKEDMGVTREVWSVPAASPDPAQAEQPLDVRT